MNRNRLRGVSYMTMSCYIMRNRWGLVLLFSLIGLTACSANPPTRDTPNAFILRNSGWVAKADIPSFVECVTDGFKKVEQSVLFNHGTYQERRKSGNRIAIAPSSLPSYALVISDVRDDGFVEVLEISDEFQGGARGVRQQGPAAFGVCLKKYETSNRGSR